VRPSGAYQGGAYVRMGRRQPAAHSVEIEIPGQPVPCPRPRVNRSGVVYDERYLRWKDSALWLIKDACVKQLGGVPLWAGSVTVIAEFYGASDTADLDNLLKSVLDALQMAGVVENDRQVKSLAGFRHPPCGSGKVLESRKTVVRVVLLDPLEAMGG